ncbi:hypothetical protein RRG08_063424 [Elysia crispata]|uniref:Uncharacterized protein n=1 Tax=Elysia crispata TaxID=231223 RepID=A0AAE1ABS9_9GAST|nr:hypothetical protein RRG08_063424 [Elysia crispata]
MANRNTTLAKLWVDDGQGSPIHVTPVTPSKSNTGESNHEFLQFFKNSGLDSVAKDCELACFFSLVLIERKMSLRGKRFMSLEVTQQGKLSGFRTWQKITGYSTHHSPVSYGQHCNALNGKLVEQSCLKLNCILNSSECFAPSPADANTALALEIPFPVYLVQNCIFVGASPGRRLTAAAASATVVHGFSSRPGLSGDGGRIPSSARALIVALFTV